MTARTAPPPAPPRSADPRLTAIEAGWGQRLIGELTGMNPGLGLTLHLHGRFLHIVDLSTEQEWLGGQTAAALRALAMAADQRGLALTASPWSSRPPVWARMRAFYRRHGFTTNPDPHGPSRADLIRRPAPPRVTWRRSGPGWPRAVEMAVDGHAVEAVVPLNRRRQAPRVVAVLRAAQVLGAAHGPCPNRTALEAYGPGPCGHLFYDRDPRSGDLVRYTEARVCVLLTRDQLPERTMAALPEAAQRAYTLGGAAHLDPRGRTR